VKLIEAMKRVKFNKHKIEDNWKKIKDNCAHLSHETPPYGAEVRNRVAELIQSSEDLANENVNLLTKIQQTNLATLVTINIGGVDITKSIAAWIWRRREYAGICQRTWAFLTDRGLKEGEIKVSVGDPMKVSIVRNFDPHNRDEKIALYNEEPHLIDVNLEIVNAVTDLV
jgi:hypothetical protein